MEKYVIGIDNGGTLAKAVIFDLKGKEIASASKKIAVITPEPGYTERDMEVLWDANAGIIKEALDKSGILPEKIIGVSCTGHGKGLYLWGKDDKPAYNGIISTDSRAWEIEEKYNSDGTKEKVYDKIYQSILACQPVCLLKWFKENKPEVLENTKHIFSIKDYVRYKLTGEAYLEMTDFSGTALMNLAERRHDKELLEEYGLGEVFDKLPPLKKSSDICGYITEEVAKRTGLTAGTPVSGGMFDIDACAIAMDVTEAKRLCVIAGTWSINEYISPTPVTNRTIMMNSLFCIPEYYLIEECSPTSASNSEWYINKFMGEEKIEAEEKGISIFDITDEMVSSVEPEDSTIVFMPFLFGSNESSIAKASFVGLNSYHSKAHILTSVYEGVVFSHKTHVDKLLLNNKDAKVIRLAGGAAKSKVWVQMFSDILQLPIEVIDVNELGALGCAMSAAIAAGEYTGYKNAAKSMVKVKYRVEPNISKKDIYQKKYTNYRKVVDALNSVWQDLV